MKRKVIGIVFACFILLSCGHLRKTGNCTYHLMLKPGKTDPATTSALLASLTHRLDQYGIPEDEIKFTPNGNLVDLSISHLPKDIETSAIMRLCMFSGSLSLWETFDVSEVYSFLTKIDEAGAQPDTVREGSHTASPLNETTRMDSLRKVHPLLSLLTLATSYNERGQLQLNPGPVLGYALASDTARVMEIFNSEHTRNILPYNVRLMWTAKPSGENKNMFSLLALRSARHNEPYLYGNIITDARLENNNSGFPGISMTMNSEAAQQWKRMTGNNIGKSIAIVLDDKVYSYPTVQSEISGGASSITGSFTREEAEEIVNILKTGNLPCTVQVTSVSFDCK